MRSTLNFGNVITAMITPFKKNGDIDYDEVELLANHLYQNGTDTVLLTGSTGEDAQLSENEKWQLVQRVRQYAPKQAKIMVATSDKNTARAIHKTKKAFELGADAVLVSVPEYIKPPQEAMLIHFGQIADSVPNKPVFIYNIPSRTGTEILPATVATLAQRHPNIVGLKQSMGNLDRVSELNQELQKRGITDFHLYSGDDSLTLPMLALGAKGVISVASHLEGSLIQKMVTDFKRGNVKAANKTHQLLFPLFQSLFITTNPMPIKEALYQKGLISKPTLRTLGEMTAQQKTDLVSRLHLFYAHKKAVLGPNCSCLNKTGRT